MSNSQFDPHGTTILSVRRGGTVAMGGDGQVTVGHTVMKGNARKVRRLYDDKVLAGFAGGTADAFTLFERFEGKLEKYGNLTRAAIELAPTCSCPDGPFGYLALAWRARTQARSRDRTTIRSNSPRSGS